MNDYPTTTPSHPFYLSGNFDDVVPSCYESQKKVCSFDIEEDLEGNSPFLENVYEKLYTGLHDVSSFK